jgi:hypothetical protein
MNRDGPTVLVHGYENETAFRAEFPRTSQQIFRPKLHFDGYLCPPSLTNTTYNLGELALPHGDVKIDALRTRRHNRSPRVS